MSVLNINSEDCVECPLCMEPLEMDDLSFFPCTCGYQICRFCWHRIRTDENGLCPACRKAYPENPADFKPLSTEEIQRIKAEKRQKDQQKKQKATENRKHLANVRVVQRNLVFVVGLSPKLADPEVLKRAEYFGKFGKIHKVVINHSTQYAGSQGPSASAYVTYVRGEDALRAIQSVNNIVVDGRTLRASLGTTKYCSHFMKNQICPKPDCMYLHEIGDDSASFTKEEMQQGKHTDYERMLLDQLFLLTNNKERRKTSTSPPLQGATPGPQAVSKDAWPSLPPGNTGNSSNSSAKGSAGPGAVKPEAAAPPPPAAAAKEKRGKSKAAAQATTTTTASGGGSGEPSHVEEAKVVTAQPRKTKEKQKATPPPTETPLQTQQTQTNVTNHNRQRSDSRSPALSSSSNPTPPPLTSSSSSVSSQENGFAPVNHLQSQIQILHQGACMAAEEEAIDRARDEAENFPAAPTNRDASTFARAMMDNSNNHSFFSTGPIAALSARSNGQSLAGCWLADGAEEGSVRSSLPDQSASDLRSVKQNSNPGAVESGYPAKSADDDLGFDPFHETQKALAEMLEKESISAASNYGNPNQVSYSNSSLYSSSQSPHQNLTRQSPGLGLGLGLNLGMTLSASQQQQQQQQPLRTRVPPPGFTPAQMGMPGVNQNSFGLSLPNMGLGLANRPSGMSEYGSSKMLPFMNHSASNGSTGSSSLGPRLFPDASNMGYGNSGFGMNYGMGVGNMGMVSSQSGSANKNQGFGMGLNSSLPFLNNSSGSSLGGLSGGAGGLGDPSGLKDWQDGLRGFFGSNNSSAVNPTNRSAMGAFPPGMNSQPANSGPSLPQTMNKSWRSSVPDWAALDPAIITSGQLSDSRSDSPPHWLRSLEQLTETAPVQSAAASQSNMFGLPSSHYFAAGMNRPTASGLDPLSQQQSTSFWPSGSMSASMPPPGFSHLRPPAKTAAADTHKLLDNL